MTDIKKIAEQLKELEDLLAVCMRCGLCQSVCPVFEETGREADVARGKLALLDGLAGKIIANTRTVQDRLLRCLLCGSCAAACPSGVKAPEIFLRARQILSVYLGLSPLKKAVFRRVLANPALFDRLLDWSRHFQSLFLSSSSNIQGTAELRFVSPLINRRRITPLADIPFHQLRHNYHHLPGKKGIRVLLFTGCLIDNIFPRIGEAVVQIMAAHEIGLSIPSDFVCCGIPALASGDFESFNRLVEHNLKLIHLEEFDYLITACGTCTAVILEHWEKANFAPGHRKIRSLKEKTMDINQFLVNIAGVQAVTQPHAQAVRVTYHDPCHLKKTLGISFEPREIIRANPGYRFIEMANADRCCGMGGSFNIEHYRLSTAIGQRKQQDISEAQCQVAATGCPACMLQISDMLTRAGVPVAVKHPVEIYADSLTHCHQI